MALTEERIAKLEAKGFKRWTKGNFDRLYINATTLGLDCDYYKTGNIRSAVFQGTSISNAEGRRMLAAKTYIDVKTGEIHSDNSALEQAVKAIVEAIDEEEAQEAAEAAEAAKAAESDENAAEQETAENKEGAHAMKYFVDMMDGEYFAVKTVEGHDTVFTGRYADAGIVGDDTEYTNKLDDYLQRELGIAPDEWEVG